MAPITHSKSKPLGTYKSSLNTSASKRKATEEPSEASDSKRIKSSHSDDESAEEITAPKVGGYIAYKEKVRNPGLYGVGCLVDIT